MFLRKHRLRHSRIRLLQQHYYSFTEERVSSIIWMAPNGTQVWNIGVYDVRYCFKSLILPLFLTYFLTPEQIYEIKSRFIFHTYIPLYLVTFILCVFLSFLSLFFILSSFFLSVFFNFLIGTWYRLWICKNVSNANTNAKKRNYSFKTLTVNSKFVIRPIISIHDLKGMWINSIKFQKRYALLRITTLAITFFID